MADALRGRLVEDVQASSPHAHCYSCLAKRLNVTEKERDAARTQARWRVGSARIGRASTQ